MNNMANECDNFGDFFVYRLENILSRNLKKETNKELISKVIKKNEHIIKNEFNFYLNSKVKVLTPPRRSRFWTIILESWRPIMMYLFMYIIGQYYIINPIIEFTWPNIKLKDLPPEMWTLLTVAVGGYITSRGVEKGIQIWKGRDDDNAVILAENMNPPNITSTTQDSDIDVELENDSTPKEEDLA